MNTLPSFDIPRSTTSLRDRITKLGTGEKLRIIEVRTGSDSDFPKIQKMLEDLADYPVLVRIASAHRTPEAMAEIARAFPNVLITCEGDTASFQSGEEEMVKRMEVVCCIGAAGGSAHIAGMTASETDIPVLGYPVPSSTLGQMESDASMRHMPPGIPNGVSADLGVQAQMAKNIYNLKKENTVYISEDVPLDAATQKLIERFGIRVTHTLEEASIGIHMHNISDQKLKYEMVRPKSLSEAMMTDTKDLGTSVPIVIPRITKAIDTTIRTMPEIMRQALVGANLLVTPGLSMSLAVQGKENLTNAILFAAKLIAINNAETRAELQKYREELALGKTGVRGKDHRLVEEQLA